MSLKLLLAGSLAVALLTSCSSAYKTGQTPDDVYFSPTRPVNEEIKKDESTKDDYSYTKPDDNYLRMKVQNRRQWNTIDDRDYWYSYNADCRCNNTWGNYNRWSYNSWDSWYSWNRPNNYYGYSSGWGYGYGYPTVYVKSIHSNTGPKPYMNGYTNNTYSNTNNTYNNGKAVGGATKTSGSNSLLKTIFGGNSNSSTTGSADTYSRPVRTYSNTSSSSSTQPASTPSSSSSSSSNSSSGRSSAGSSSSTPRTGRGG